MCVVFYTVTFVYICVFMIVLHKTRIHGISVYMYVSMYACMYVWMYVYMYVCLYVA
jgi:hypothetical protein